MTLEEIAAMAKENLLQDGVHCATLVATESEGRGIVIQLPTVPPTYEQRVQLMFRAGVENANIIPDVNQVFFICEVWVRSLRPDGSVIPESVEALAVVSYDVVSESSRMLVFEMLRDRAGNLVGLEDRGDQRDGKAESPLLVAFIEGLKSGVRMVCN